ncbi:MAG: antitoxin family protein [Desulfurococcales archaeon]|nr:antitoxin family protein [Desulfurococcales archaeon]
MIGLYRDYDKIKVANMQLLAFGDIGLSFTVRAKYEKGVLRPLENVNLKEGEVVIIIIKKKPNIDKFVRVLGKASARELKANEEVYSS